VAAAALRTLGAMLARHATDLPTWGAFWVLAIAAVTAAARGSSAARGAARAVGLQATVLLGAVALGSPAVRAFTANGTLLNRLLIELVPGLVVVVACVLDDGARRESAAARTTA
jgi:hypothetical protein